MKKIQFLGRLHIFFIGIGGISMSGLAKLMLNFGKKVSGSDLHLNNLTTHLSKLGATIYPAHLAKNITNDVDLVVYSGAISSNNPELLYAKQTGICCMERSQFLGEVCNLFKTVIAVSGTHGKTTTTALIGNILLKAGLQPTIHVGGKVVNGYNNFYVGATNYFVTEACEYKKSLEHIHSTYAVITNIEKDHMDCYADINDLYHTFGVFAKKCGGTLFTSQSVLEFSNIKHKNSVTVGNNNAEYFIKNLTQNKRGYCRFKVYYKTKSLGAFKLKIMGKYNATNALFAIAVTHKLGLPLKFIKRGVNSFCGVKRRNEYMGKYKGIKVFADYAHHPTEIQNSLANFKKIYGNVCVIFQPHTFSRTKFLKTEFTNCFSDAYRLVLYKTYPARENSIEGGTETDMFKYVNFNKQNKYLALNLTELMQELPLAIKNCKAIVVLGAGDLYDYVNKVFNFKQNLAKCITKQQ